MKNNYKYIWNLFKNNKTDILLISFISLVIAIINIVPPFFLQILIDEGMIKNNSIVIIKFAVGILTVYTLSAMLVLFKEKRRLNIYAEVSYKLKKNAIDHLYKTESDFFYDTNSTAVLNFLEKDIQSISEIVGSETINLITSLLASVGGMIALIVINWKLSIIVFIFIIIKFILTNIITRKNVKQVENNIAYNQKYSRWFGEFVSGIFTIRFFGMQEKKNEEFELLQNKIISSNYNSMIYNCINIELEKILVQFLMVSIYIIAGVVLLENSISIGEIITFETYALTISAPIMGIFDILYGISYLNPSIKRYCEFMMNNGEKNGIVSNNIDNRIEMTDVTFAYNDKLVLKQCEIKIDEKEKVAIVGLNGSGKSTLINLLARILRTGQGKIFVGGNDIVNYDEKYLYHLIGIVSQDIYLFNDTIKNNICCFKNIETSELKQILIDVGLFGFVKEKGLDYYIGENGNKLSGGQKQRIAIARLLAHDTPIMIFDESTSHLDDNSLGIVCNLFSSRLKEKTVVCVTHHKEMLKYFSSIYKIDNGEIVKVQ